jgi:tetratricopeptide (TPR) repeat protein
MTAHAWWNTRVLAAGLCLGLAAPAPAGAFQLFPTAEIQEAHTLRQRILTEAPQLDLQQRRQHPKLPPETVRQIQQRLNALQTREAENPFWYWAQGELIHQSQGIAPATSFFARARQLAGGRFLIHWLLWQEYLARDLLDDARREEAVLQALQVGWGLTRFPLLSTELMRSGDEAAQAGDPPRAAALYDAAVANTPESAQALFGRAAYTWQADKTQLLSVIGDVLRGIALTLQSSQTGYHLSSNLVLSLVVTCLVMLSVVAVILALRVQPLFGHELNERVLKSFPPPAQFSLGVLCFLLPLVLGFGLVWSAVLVLLISAPYLTVRERIGVSVLLTLLAVLPSGYQWVAARHVLDSSAELALIQTVEQGGRGESLVQDLTRWSREEPNNGLAHYYLGLTLKRRGDLPQAEAAMTRAAKLLPRASFTLVALGNLQYLRGNLPEAEERYRQAAELSPSAAAQMNLFKLYAQRLQFEQSNDALSRSTKLDPYMAQTLSRFHGQGGAEFVVDEAVPWDALVMGLVPDTRDVAAMAEGLWGAPLREVPLTFLPYIAGLFVILFWANVALRGRMPPVRRCHQCGTPFCFRCQRNPKEKEYCAACATVFRPREGGVAAFVKVRRIREGEEWARRLRTRIGILGSLLPGGNDLYQGRVIWGLALALPAVWLLLEGLVLDFLTPTFRFLVPIPGPVRWTVAALLLLGLYVCSMQRSWRQPARGDR